VTRLRALYVETYGRFRGAVAVLALAAWTLSAFACPMPDYGTDAVHAHEDAPALRGHVREHGQQTSHPDSDLCCALLSDVHAIAQPLATTAAKAAPAPSVVAAIVEVAGRAADAGPAARLTPLSNGPPRNLYQRFATFWSHAPPADLA
jgi:hypothetical protein